MLVKNSTDESRAVEVLDTNLPQPQIQNTMSQPYFRQMYMKRKLTVFLPNKITFFGSRTMALKRKPDDASLPDSDDAFLPIKKLTAVKPCSVTPMKPWSVDDFEKQRPHLTDFVRTKIVPLLNDPKCTVVVVRAPVKCGKREMVEYIAKLDQLSTLDRLHAFVSALHRKADDDQRDELGAHNIKVFTLHSQKTVKECLECLHNHLSQSPSRSVVLHIDECDHGSGSNQLLSKVWSDVRDDARITSVLYSATPEEVLFAGHFEEDEDQPEMVGDMVDMGHSVSYTPPEGYCGPERFLSADLVHEALPFFHKTEEGFCLSAQGKTIMSDLRAAIKTDRSRNIVILRLSYSDLGGKKADIKKNKAIYQFLGNIASFPELADCIVVVDKGDDMGIKNSLISTEKIQWSAANYWRRQTEGEPILIVIDQTSSRSTEWACHDRVFATHDYRNNVQYITISQAQERVNHYEQRYNGFQPIRIYGHKKSLELSAKIISYGDYLSFEWEKTKTDSSLFLVRKTMDHSIHPTCIKGMVEGDADALLQQLGCKVGMSLSNRVAGNVRAVRTYVATWHAVTKDTWDAFWPNFRDDPANGMTLSEGTRDLTRNPFMAAEKHRLEDVWLGQHRGWKVLVCVGNELYHQIDGAAPKKEDIGWGALTSRNRIKVCYKDGVLGVFIARCTGTHAKDTLRTCKSMYSN